MMSDYAKVRKILKQHQRGLMTINEAIGEISAMLGIPLIPGTFDNPFEVGHWVRWVGKPSDVGTSQGPCQNGQCVGKVTSLAQRTTWVKWGRTCSLHQQSLNEREPAATDCLRVVGNPHILGDLVKWPGQPKTDNAPQRALNDPKVDCCGRDVADCDCPDIADELDKADIPWVSPGPSESDIAEQAERVRKADAWVETGVWVKRDIADNIVLSVN